MAIPGYIGIVKVGSGVNVLSNRGAVNTPGRSSQDAAVYSANLLSQCARTVCSPRAVGPAELSAGHAVFQGQRPQTGPQKWILCANGQVLGWKI